MMDPPSRNRTTVAIPLLIVLVLGVLIQLDLIALAFRSLGLSRGGAIALFVACVAGSLVNIPLFRMRRDVAADLEDEPPVGAWPWPPRLHGGHTIVAVNVGGAVVPGAFAAHLWLSGRLGVVALLCVAFVAAVSRALSRVEPGVGVTMPVFIAPLSAAFIALAIDPAHAAPLAYIGGTFGVLIGADLLRLNQTARFGAPVASIGGAGTFDGIFLTGIVAVLLT